MLSCSYLVASKGVTNCVKSNTKQEWRCVLDVQKSFKDNWLWLPFKRSEVRLKGNDKQEIERALDHVYHSKSMVKEGQVREK